MKFKLPVLNFNLKSHEVVERLILRFQKPKLLMWKENRKAQRKNKKRSMGQDNHKYRSQNCILMKLFNVLPPLN